MPIPEQDGPTILTTPQDEEPKRENPGCGSTDPIQLPTHTDGCGENIQTPEEKREQLILHAEIGKLVNKPVNELKKGDLSGIDKYVVEPKKGTPEWDRLYPNGKYNGDNYHKPGGSSKKSPCPKNGQAALDRSIPVEGSRQRVTTENDKIVILRHEGNGVYHGYLVEDFHSLDPELQKALVDNDLVKNMKSGKIKK